LQKTAQSTQALNFVGSTAIVDGSTATLKDGAATWALGVSKPSSVTITISNSVGQAVYTGSFSMNAGDHQAFQWDGRGNDGSQWPEGSYTLTATAKDASGQSAAVSTEIQGVVQAADLSQDPPTLSIGDQSFTVDKVKKVISPASSS
jgi:flagellar basal-body rod modification protein FlgD